MNETDLDDEVQCLFDGEVFDLISVEEDDEERDSPHLVLDMPETWNGKPLFRRQSRVRLSVRMRLPERSETGKTFPSMIRASVFLVPKGGTK